MLSRLMPNLPSRSSKPLGAEQRGRILWPAFRPSTRTLCTRTGRGSFAGLMPEKSQAFVVQGHGAFVILKLSRVLLLLFVQLA